MDDEEVKPAKEDESDLYTGGRKVRTQRATAFPGKENHFPDAISLGKYNSRSNSIVSSVSFMLDQQFTCDIGSLTQLDHHFRCILYVRE